MKVNEIQIKQNANQVTDPNTQVSAEEFNALVDNAKESVTSMEVLAGQEEVKLSYGKGKGTTPTLTFPNATAAGAGMMSPKQAARIADRTATDGMGYVVLDKDKTFAEQVTQENTIYEIRNEFDLGGQTKEIPGGCVLKFEGGKLSDGTLKGNNTYIDEEDNLHIFDGVSFTGTFKNTFVNVCWFGAVSSLMPDYSLKNADVSDSIQTALDIDCTCGIGTVYIPVGVYYIGKTLHMNSAKNIVLEGKSPVFKLANIASEKYNPACAVVYTTTNMDMLCIDIGKPSYDPNQDNRYSIGITGGQWDISKAPNEGFTSSVLKIGATKKGNTKIWGLSIETAIVGNNQHRYDNNSTGILFDLDNSGYATMVRIKSDIRWLCYGIRDSEFSIATNGAWCTDIVDESIILCRCAIRLMSAYSTRLYGSYQVCTIYPKGEDGPGIIELYSSGHTIGAKIWDLNQPVNTIVEGVTEEWHTNKYGVIAFEGASSIRLVGSASEVYEARLVKGLERSSQIPVGMSQQLYPKSYNPLYNCINELTASASVEVSGDVQVSSETLPLFETDDACVLTMPNLTDNDPRYVDYTISLKTKRSLSFVGIRVHTIGGYYQAFGKIKCSLYNDEVLVDEKITENEKRIVHNEDVNDVIFNFDPHPGKQVNKITFRLSNAIPETYGSIGYAVIYNVFANSYQTYQAYVTADGRNNKIMRANFAHPVIDASHSTAEIDALYGSTIGVMAFDFQGALHKNTDIGWGRPLLCDPEITQQGGWGVPNKKPSATHSYFPSLYNDVSVGKTYYFRSTRKRWEEYDACAAGVKRVGTKSEAPASADIYKGFQYFATDLGKPIWWNGSAWVDSTGATV